MVNCTKLSEFITLEFRLIQQSFFYYEDIIKQQETIFEKYTILNDFFKQKIGGV